MSGMGIYFILFTLFLLPGLVPSGTWAATLKGTVSVAQMSSAPPARYVTRSSEPATRESGESLPLIAVILEPVNESALAGKAAISATSQVMAQQGTAFVPNLLIVPCGGVVSFPNHDPIFHNVFSYSSAKSFDLGRYPRGETRTVTFSTPGVVRVFCEIHATMYASIVVTASPWHALLPSGSEFAFGGLPSGDYHLLAVDAAGRLTTMDVELRAEESRSVALVLGS